MAREAYTNFDYVQLEDQVVTVLYTKVYCSQEGLG